MTTMQLSARPNPQVLPRLRVIGDLMAFEQCPLRYRLHVVGRWPEVDALDGRRLAGTFVHVALDTAFRRWVSDGRTVPVVVHPEGPLARAHREIAGVAGAKQARDLTQAIARASRLVTRFLVEIAPHLFPALSASELRLSATRPFSASAIDEPRYRRVTRFEVVGVIDALLDPRLVLPENPIRRALSSAQAAVGMDVGAGGPCVIDYKLFEGAAAVGGRNDRDLRYDRQLRTYALIHSQFHPTSATSGAVISLNDLCPEPEGEYHAPTPEQLATRLAQSVRVVPLTEQQARQTTAWVDTIAGQIEEASEAEAHGVPFRQGWPGKVSARCGTCDVRPICPAWEHAGLPSGGVSQIYEAQEADGTRGEPDDA